MLARLFRNIFQLIFPPFCCHCHRYGELLCDDCYEALLFLPNSGKLHIQQQYLTQITAATEYTGVTISLIHALKYSYVKDIGLVLGKLLFYCTVIPKVDSITCVPMHPWKENQRGFNQAEIIAKELARLSKIDYIPYLQKRFYQQSQARIKSKDIREKRARNMYGVDYHYYSDIKEKTILLIDDVCTTGTTLNECAKALKSARAKAVYGLVVAHKTS